MNAINFKLNGQELRFLLRDDVDDSVFSEIFKIREYRCAERLISLCQDPIIDVGGHAGFFSFYARMLNRSARIIAVEPEEKNIVHFKKHLKLNLNSDIELMEGAIGEKTGRAHLLVAKDSHNHRLELGKTGNKSKSAIVQVWTLHDLMKKCIINAIGLLKLDVEGSEFSIIKSLSSEDLQKITGILIEYHGRKENDLSDITDKLRENGFGTQIFPSKFAKKMGFIYAVNKRSNSL